jgi:branched-chain amino acid transport system ATP-binding protein/neutral amino acid transport system ATP-binding protein
MALIAVDDVVAGYGASDEILKGVSLHADAAEIVSIIGPNGAGKSTLLKVIAGMLPPRRGSVRFAGAPIERLPARKIAQQGIAFVAQEQNTFPSLSVRENLEIGGYLLPQGRAERIEAMMDRFVLLRERRRQAARTLSGGQRQTLAVAAALMASPKLLLLDEPSAGLSPKAAEELFATLVSIRDSGVSILMVEQNALAALEISNRAYILVLGRNARDGDARTLAADPEIRHLFLGGSA